MTKYCALLLFACGAWAADFTTGQAARLVIGQETFTKQAPGASETILGAASGIAYVNDTLFVVDGNRVNASPQNNRVLVFPRLASMLPKPLEAIEQTRRCPVCGGVAELVLGQEDFSKTNVALTQSGLRTPTAVASDGRIVVVADTDNNRVLIWNSIPARNNQPADVVVGQPNFTSGTLNFGGSGNTPSAKGLRGPQGVWIQDGKLFVADTQNHRVLIWNRIPTSNGQDADVVVGQANFTSFVETDIGRTRVEAKANNLLNPVSVTSDGLRLYVADLGHNRVLIWNTIPTQNGVSADIALGQPNMTSAISNNSPGVCPASGKDDKGNNTYPARCSATLDFPRYALSDGRRLFVADGGNDRVLVFNRVPTDSGQAPDTVLGQPSGELAVDSQEQRIGSPDALRTPMSLAWDGTNLYVSDPFNRRILVFTVSEPILPSSGLRNAASREVFAVGSLTFSGKVKENDEITIQIGSKEYKYKVVKDDTFEKVISALVERINAGEGDPLVLASPNVRFGSILLTARAPGEEGNTVELSTSTSSGAEIVIEASAGRLREGASTAKIAPGTLITLVGGDFADRTESAPDVERLPTSLGGVQVYIDGLRVPLLFVSPTQINAQMPFDVYDAISVSAYVRTERADGSVRISNAIAVPIIPENPGIFAEPGSEPRAALAYHASSFATGVISVDGTIKENDVATVVIEDREYKYTVTKDDTLASVRDKLIALINEDEKVAATAATVFTRIRLRSKIPGKEGEDISYAARVNDGANLILSPLTPTLCCSNTQGARITEENPAVPGETIIIYGTGLGFVQPEEAKHMADTGVKYSGPEENIVNSPVDALAGGKTANVLTAGLKPGLIGVYELVLQLNSDLPSNPRTQLTIAQDIYISNIVTFPLVNPNQAVE